VMWNKPRRVGWADDFAREAFYQFRDELESVQDATTIAPELLARVPEQTLKLATLRAVSEHGPEDAAVGYWDLEWAAAWALESAKSMIESVSTLMAANLYEKNLNRVRAFVEDRGTATTAEILRKFRDISTRDLKDITDRLTASGDFEAADVTTKGRTAKGIKTKGGKG
jgi:hypothetical protein